VLPLWNKYLEVILDDKGIYYRKVSFLKTKSLYQYDASLNSIQAIFDSSMLLSGIYSLRLTLPNQMFYWGVLSWDFQSYDEEKNKQLAYSQAQLDVKDLSDISNLAFINNEYQQPRFFYVLNDKVNYQDFLSKQITEIHVKPLAISVLDKFFKEDIETDSLLAIVENNNVIYVKILNNKINAIYQKKYLINDQKSLLAVLSLDIFSFNGEALVFCSKRLSAYSLLKERFNTRPFEDFV
jgi:hypothetical protein